MGKRKIITRFIVGLALLAGLAVFYNNRANGPTLDDLSPDDFAGYPGLPELLKTLQDAKKEHFESLEDADIMEMLAGYIAQNDKNISAKEIESRLDDYLGGEEKNLSLPPGYKGKLLEILRALLREPRGIIYPKIHRAKLAIKDSELGDEISVSSLKTAIDIYQRYRDIGVPLDNLKWSVLDILSTMRENASPAIPELLKLVEDADYRLQSYALEVLSMAGDDKIVPDLKQFVESIPNLATFYYTHHQAIEFKENGDLVLRSRFARLKVIFRDQELIDVIKNDNLQGYNRFANLTDVASRALMLAASNSTRAKLLNDPSPRIRAAALLWLLDNNTTPEEYSPLFFERVKIVLKELRKAPTPFERICAAKCLGEAFYRLRQHPMAISDKLAKAFQNEKNTGVKAAILTAMDPYWAYQFLLEVAENPDANLFFRRIAVNKFANYCLPSSRNHKELEQYRRTVANRLLAIALNEKNPPPLRNLAIVGAARKTNSPVITAKIVKILQKYVNSLSQNTSGEIDLGDNFLDVLRACSEPSILPFLKKLRKNKQIDMETINKRIAYFESKNNK